MNEFYLMINGIFFFEQLVKNNKKTYKDIQKINNDNDVLTGCLLDFPDFNEHCILIAIKLSKK